MKKPEKKDFGALTGFEPVFTAVYYAVQGSSNFESVDEIKKCDH